MRLKSPRRCPAHELHLIHIHINKKYFNVVYHRYMDVQRENRITHKIQYNTPQNNLRVIMFVFVFMWWKK
jgi:hypothetical protein